MRILISKNFASGEKMERKSAPGGNHQQKKSHCQGAKQAVARNHAQPCNKNRPPPPALQKPVITTHIFCVLAACEVGHLQGCGKSMFRCLECRVKFGFMGL